MANHKSAAKRARQDLKKSARNAQTKKTIRTFEKKIRLAISEKKTDEAQKLFQDYASRIAKAAQKGILHANNAARKTSRIAKAIVK